MSADYLFQQDKCYDVKYDTGDKAMQCGRRNDVFKLWLMWRSKVWASNKHYLTLLGHGRIPSSNQPLYGPCKIFH